MLTLNDISFEQALEYYGRSISALLVVDENTDSYRSVVRKGIFLDLLDESGTYANLVQKLWFHHNDDGRKITDTYNVFIPNMSKFTGKNSRRLKLLADGIPHIVQMLILPLDEEGRYLFFLDELDKHVFEEETETENKVSSIQNNIYVFTMTFDLANDTTRSVSLTEVSDEPLNYQLSYSEWRKTIVNMVPDEDKELFLTRSDPDYLRAHFKPGHMESFDLQMINLDGIYQWVKLIFSRANTQNDDDFRFVFMVQDINENSIELLSTLKKYEELALTDPLTRLYNHGGIETEMYNAIDNLRKDGVPVSFMMLDMDHFKNVNDSFGHSVGDVTLKKFAEILTDYMAGEKSFVGRWGGEEFVIICYGKSGDEAFNFAENLRKKVEETEFPEIKHITCSIGITDLTAEDTFDEAFNRMDKAMYASKESGRNIVSRL